MPLPFPYTMRDTEPLVFKLGPPIRGPLPPTQAAVVSELDRNLDGTCQSIRCANEEEAQELIACIAFYHRIEFNDPRKKS